MARIADGDARAKASGAYAAAWRRGACAWRRQRTATENAVSEGVNIAKWRRRGRQSASEEEKGYLERKRKKRRKKEEKEDEKQPAYRKKKGHGKRSIAGVLSAHHGAWRWRRRVAASWLSGATISMWWHVVRFAAAARASFAAPLSAHQRRDASLLAPSLHICARGTLLGDAQRPHLTACAQTGGARA
jgi:hypothetical protein